MLKLKKNKLYEIDKKLIDNEVIDDKLPEEREKFELTLEEKIGTQKNFKIHKN